MFSVAIIETIVYSQIVKSSRVPKFQGSSLANLKVRVPRALHRRLSTLSAAAEMTLQEAVAAAVEAYFPKLEAVAKKKDEAAA